MGNLLQKITTSMRLRMSKLWCPEAKRKVIHTQINGYEMLVLANEDVGRQIHYGGSYEQAETDYLRTRIRPDSICVDVGANIGYFTMLMAQCSANVHAFEPITLNASLLRASAELNSFTNICINQCAVGDVEGEVSFSQSADSAYSSMIDTDRKPLHRVISVPSITLDAYLDRELIPRVDLLKVDVEGAEELVISGASRLLSDDKRKPNLILMELYDDNLKAFGSSVDFILGKLKSFGYAAFAINGQGQALPYTDELKAAYYNVVFLPLAARGQ